VGEATEEQSMADNRAKRLQDLIVPLRVEAGKNVVLSRDHDPGFTAGWPSKKEAAKHLAPSVEVLAEYQDRLAAQDTYGLLVVLQGLDAAGKDGTIRHVMSGVNPQGVSVHSFKVPSEEELDHDFLWRYGRHLPARGQIGIFNRSHYEEVLVVRVHPELLGREKLPPSVLRGDMWKRRYRDINAWERYLVDNGIRVIKLFLNVSREEQRIRLLKRIELPQKNWKFSPADVKEREHWEEYQQAFSAMLTHTSTTWAPWYVIPADHKWFARLAVGAVIAQTLTDINPQYPTVDEQTRRELEWAKQTLEAEAREGSDSDRVQAKVGVTS
jgi:PPK2 family polyphosphate:nucleotide phosphotransferase